MIPSTPPAAPHEACARHLADEAATTSAGRALSACVSPGLTIFLSGPLGAGKTCLVRGLLRGLGVQGRVKSPTYSLVELYAVSRLNLYHFDFYRFNDTSEWIDAGFRDHFGGDQVCLVEWPEKAGDQLPAADLWIHLSLQGTGRELSVTASSDKGRKCLACWDAALQASGGA